ncbi:MAG: hypothetical protein IKZ28_06030, partial [Clostridia bacterium]|nr:hypothetical protein [Clostridia bacterium]
MEEIILQNKKNGMRTLLVCLFVELLATAGIIVAAVLDTKGAEDGLWITLATISLIVACVAWIPLCG